MKSSIFEIIKYNKKSVLLETNEIDVPLIKKKSRFEIEESIEYDKDIDECVILLLRNSKEIENEMSKYLLQYYFDYVQHKRASKIIENPSVHNILQYVRFSNRISVSIDVERKIKNIYFSISGGCEWEDEHGLQVVIKNGTDLCKLGPYDGHVTNDHALGRKYRNKIYVHLDTL